MSAESVRVAPVDRKAVEARPHSKRAGSMVPVLDGSRRAPAAHRRRVGVLDRLSRLREGQRLTLGTRKARRTARSTRRMVLRRNSREGSRGIGSEAVGPCPARRVSHTLVLFLFYVSV